jgi:hypothetical protein
MPDEIHILRSSDFFRKNGDQKNTAPKEAVVTTIAMRKLSVNGEKPVNNGWGSA